ncbi:MAG: hypothetical protein U5K56_21815 [Halioglobus sp.]|nr:hypothetical protein [Halioglobus sp.]
MNSVATSLPQPDSARWRPLRLGLIELYHYDAEEFWFERGRLLLRGNNGTGKSKVLSLTLPFLLDANLSSARVEPDADRGKRMEWNLLMGGRYERRTGYTWIEFGRIDDGEPRYLTLGCGLRATAGRAGVDSWFFVSERRVGASLRLVTDQRTALNRERLAEELGSHAVFTRARDYRRCVDEQLFHLGSERYDALIDTLIQLRQPQLSSSPNEANLSAALSRGAAAARPAGARGCGGGHDPARRTARRTERLPRHAGRGRPLQSGLRPLRPHPGAPPRPRTAPGADRVRQGQRAKRAGPSEALRRGRQAVEDSEQGAEWKRRDRLTEDRRPDRGP